MRNLMFDPKDFFLFLGGKSLVWETLLLELIMILNNRRFDCLPNKT